MILHKETFGYIDGRICSDGTWWVDKLIVYGKFRGQGYGKLLASMCPIGSSLLAYPLVTENGLDFNSLINMYKSSGWKLEPDKHGNSVMRKEISNANFSKD